MNKLIIKKIIIIITESSTDLKYYYYNTNYVAKIAVKVVAVTTLLIRLKITINSLAVELEGILNIATLSHMYFILFLLSVISTYIDDIRVKFIILIYIEDLIYEYNTC